MAGGEERVSFLSYVFGLDARFYQERKIGLDLYHSGYGGLVTFCLGIAALVVFLLAIFHVIPSRKHVTVLLLGIGVLALGVGTATSYWHFRELAPHETWADAQLEPRESALVRADGGALPVTGDQQAAIIALPTVTGIGVAVFVLAGNVYMALFWGASLLPFGGEGRQSGQKKKAKSKSKAHRR